MLALIGMCSSCRCPQDNVPVPVVITAFADKSFKYVMKTPPASYFIKKVGFSLEKTAVR